MNLLLFCLIRHVLSISFEGKTQNCYSLFLFVEYGALPPQVLGMPLSFNFVAYPSEYLWVGMNLLFCNTNIQAMSWYNSILPTQQWSEAVQRFCTISLDDIISYWVWWMHPIERPISTKSEDFKGYWTCIWEFLCVSLYSSTKLDKILSATVIIIVSWVKIFTRISQMVALPLCYF